MRNVFFKVLMFLLIISGLVPVLLYFWVFHFGLAQVHSLWGEFGSFLSPFVSILAFVGLLYSIEITKNQFQRQSEESGFFNLLDLHVNKVNEMTGGSRQRLKGIEAFRYYADLLELGVNCEVFSGCVQKAGHVHRSAVRVAAR